MTAPPGPPPERDWIGPPLAGLGCATMLAGLLWALAACTGLT